MSEIRRLAVANRGEAAMRCLTAVAELNRETVGNAGPRITTVAVYTEPDAQSWFVREADEAVSLGPATRVTSTGQRVSAYCDEEHLLATLQGAGVDAVWVGWGFSSESATFAERCERAGIVFVGPSSEAIRRVGDKVAAKRLAESVAVPVVPWSGGPVSDVETAAKWADRLGYPVVLKAVAGGGGRGIRVVREPRALADALASAQAEAMLAFGDPSVFLEQYVARARHVEVQVVLDAYGSAWPVGVRDCSIQRRNQKVVEESASTILDAEAEQAIRDAAVRVTEAASYRNAGTVEFLVDGDGRFLFMEVNARLQVEHPVTEATTGLDLVKLQLHVARGGRLEGSPPAALGHAIEVRLNAEDPEQGFAPSPGRIALFRPPAGPGIRVDTGVTEGDVVAPEFDSMIAKIIARGRDRDEALARMRRALAQTTVVLEGGATNRSFLLALLERPEVQAGHFDNRWLDELAAAKGHVPHADPVAVLQAAVEAYDADQAAAQAVFHAAAARGRPEIPERVGHAVVLTYRGATYRLSVFRTGPSRYRIDTGSGLVDVEVERLGAYERRLLCHRERHHTVAVASGPSFLIDIDSVTHRVSRDDGGVIRTLWPAFVVRILVSPGDTVEQGDPLVVLESMKMESTVSAPYAGQVASVEASANTQVDAGDALLRIRAGTTAAVSDADAQTVDFSTLLVAETGDECGPDRAFAALRGYLLGYDLDPERTRRLVADVRRVGECASPDDPSLLASEQGLLALFADVTALSRPRPDTEEDDLVGAPQEYLYSYLQWLDPDRAGLPTSFRDRLTQVLARYGVRDLMRSPELETAVVWMFRSFRRTGDLVPAVTAVLDRLLRFRDRIAPLAGPDLRALLDRVAAAAQDRHQVVADLAREVRFRYFDEPVLERVVADVYAVMEAHLDALAADPHRPDRESLVEQLVWSPQPMRAVLLRRWHEAASLEGGDDEFRKVLLETYVRRYYRTRELHSLAVEKCDAQLVCSADYELPARRVHLVVAYTPLADLTSTAAAIASHLGTVDADQQAVVDLTTWRPGARSDADAMAAQVQTALEQCDFGRDVHRVDVAVTCEGETSAGESERTQHFTFRQTAAGGFSEELLYRNLHPMIAKRLELWRLSNFVLERLPSTEDVYLFRAVAHDNPKDVRLFALAEVRDLTPVRDADGRMLALPRLERMSLYALSAMHRVLAATPPKARPQMNRIVLYVRPPWDVPPEWWREVADKLAPLASGVSLDKVVLRVQIPEPGGLREAVLHVEGVGRRGVTVRERPPGDVPIRPLTEYRQKVLRAQRVGAPYPYEIVRMLTPAPGTMADFPPGQFVEYDLDLTGALVPVQRTYGHNTANLVVGLITSFTDTVPEGMTRVALFGDPTRSLGSLAEPECRRIMAALDLAEHRHLPVEWYTLSSGARIAMDSGTENMDWIGAVLRRIIEFTQRGGEVNIVVTGINVGAQPYWNGEATMLMHTRGILVMTPDSAMVLTGKQALDFSGGVSAEDNFGIGGFEHVMGPNGQGQYWAPNLQAACTILLRHYEFTYVVPGERFPRRFPTTDPVDRDVRTAPHPSVDGSEFTVVGDVFSEIHNPERKKPFDIRAVMRAVADADTAPLERWARWRAGAETGVVWDARIGGLSVCLLGFESRSLPRGGFVPADGPPTWTSGTLFPQSSRKIARAINAASGNRPVVVLANLSGFDGSPESMRHWQLEYGAEIGRAVTNFRGPLVFVVVSRYHGGAFVVFSKRLNDTMQIAAVEGAYASVIGGAPAAAVVFARDVTARTEQDPRVVKLRAQLAEAGLDGEGLRTQLHETLETVRAEKLGEVAAEFDRVHSIQRARSVGSVDEIIPAARLRPYVVAALERALEREPIRVP